MNNTDLAHREHEFFSQQLPWYANRTLSHGDQRRVEQHLKACRQCRRDLQVLQSLQSSVANADIVVPATAPALRSVLDRIERDNSQPSKTSPQGFVALVMARLRECLLGSTQLQVALAVIAVSAIAALLLVDLNDSKDSQAPYSVLSSDGAERDIRVAIEFAGSRSIAEATAVIEEVLSGDDIDYHLRPDGDARVVIDIAELAVGKLAAALSALQRHSSVLSAEIMQ